MGELLNIYVTLETGEFNLVELRNDAPVIALCNAILVRFPETLRGREASKMIVRSPDADAEPLNPRETLASAMKRHATTKNWEVYVQMPEQKETTFVANGLPPLGTRKGSRSPHSETFRHKAVVAEEAKFAPCEDLALLSVRSVLWNSQTLDQLKTYTGGNDIQTLVTIVLREAITAAGLSGEVTCLSELSVLDLQANIWLLMSHGHPIGVVVVKLPDEMIMQSPHVYGQMFDHMMSLRSFHGLKHVFGIVTTYEEWQIFWLPEAMNAAASTVVVATPAEMKDEEVSWNPQGDQLHMLAQQADAKVLPSPMAASCYRSGVFQWNARHLPLTLCSVLRKMHASPIEQVKLIDDSRLYIVMTPDQWVWHAPKWKGFELTHSKLPKQTEAAEFFLLRELGSGRDGSVWHACTRSGRGCALKFSKAHDDAEGALTLECANWKRINSEFNQIHQVRVLKLGDRWCLLLPYLHTFDSWTLAQSEAVKKVVRKTADKNLAHQDLKKRHFGFFSSENKGAQTPLMLDLVDVATMDPEAAFASMTQQLFEA